MWIAWNLKAYFLEKKIIRKNVINLLFTESAQKEVKANVPPTQSTTDL